MNGLRLRRQTLAEWLHVASVQYRLQELWHGLTPEEQELMKVLSQKRPFFDHEPTAQLTLMAQKGVCRQVGATWQINGALLEAFVQTGLVAGEELEQERDRIWLDERTGELYRGHEMLADLRPLERAMLQFFLQHPERFYTKSQLIQNVWPHEIVSDDSVYQVISGLRKKIEPDPSQPIHIISRREWPEGGYQFFPNG